MLGDVVFLCVQEEWNKMGFGKYIALSLSQSLIQFGCINNTKFLHLQSFGQVAGLCLSLGSPASFSPMFSSLFWKRVHPCLGWSQFTGWSPLIHPVYMVKDWPIGFIFDWAPCWVEKIFWKPVWIQWAKFRDSVVMSAMGWEGWVVAWMLHICHPCHGHY